MSLLEHATPVIIVLLVTAKSCLKEATRTPPSLGHTVFFQWLTVHCLQPKTRYNTSCSTLDGSMKQL